MQKTHSLAAEEEAKWRKLTADKTEIRDL